MFMISKETMNSVMALREKMVNPVKKAECIADLEDMIKTKESHIARADWGTCCGDICSLVPQLESEIQMLQNILEALRNGDRTKAASLLEDYISFLQKNYTPEPDHM
jgi:uncharacterized protein CbrC (UPF0167 family)